VQNVSDIAFLKALGNRVREIRISQNLTQEDLGFKVGNSGKQIGRIERGENNVTTCMIYAITKALNISLSEFYDFQIKSKKKK
jgi:transcriptional regulator with XRE-family HTH domain